MSSSEIGWGFSFSLPPLSLGNNLRPVEALISKPVNGNKHGAPPTIRLSGLGDSSPRVRYNSSNSGQIGSGMFSTIVSC